MIVHSGMVAHHSAVLQKLVDGDMAEATSRVATLVDVDPDTFARFSQWGYTGDYTAVHPEILLDSSMIGTDQPDVEAKLHDPNLDDVSTVASLEVDSPPDAEPEGWPREEEVLPPYFRQNRRAPHRTSFVPSWASEPPPP